MGRATEQLAERMGEGVGGLLNATFGNAAELNHCSLRRSAPAFTMSLRPSNRRFDRRQHPSEYLAHAMLAGGLRRSEQRFNAPGARAQATMLLLAAIGLSLTCRL